MTRLGAVRGVAFVAVLAVLPVWGFAHWMLTIAVFTLMYAGLASAWNLLGGFAGYPSLGHAAFFGIGAYVEGIWFTHHSIGGGYLPFAVLPVVGIAVGVVSLPVGWIAMRTRTDVFAIVTITLLFVVQTLAFNLHSLTSGAQGLVFPAPPFAAADFERPFYYVLLILLVASMVITWATMRSKSGLALLAIRADEDKAHGVGVHVTLAKLLAFSVSVGITAMIGGVWAYFIGFIYPQFAVDPLVTIGMVLMAYLGGRATLWGPVLGAFILAPAQQYLAYQYGASQLYLVAYAGVFLVIMLLLPRGILPTLADLVRRRKRARRSAGTILGSPSAVPQHPQGVAS